MGTDLGKLRRRGLFAWLTRARYVAVIWECRESAYGLV